MDTTIHPARDFRKEARAWVRAAARSGRPSCRASVARWSQQPSGWRWGS